MFLNQIKTDIKYLFLDLCQQMSLVDEVLHHEEKAIMKAYCREMDVPEDYLDEDEEIALDDILQRLTEKADESEKKIILLELLGLAKIDGTFDNNEKSLLNYIADKFRVEPKAVKELEDLLDEYYEVYQRLYNTVFA